LAERGIEPCIPSKANRKTPIPHDRTLYRQRHRIENMFGKLKDWRRIHTRYDRCAHTWTLLFTSPNRLVCDSIRLLMADGDHDDERAWFLRFR